MNALKTILSNLCLCFGICLVVLTYIDGRNPMMAFLHSAAGHTFLYLTAVLAIATGLVLYISHCKAQNRK